MFSCVVAHDFNFLLIRLSPELYVALWLHLCSSLCVSFFCDILAREGVRHSWTVWDVHKCLHMTMC